MMMTSLNNWSTSVVCNVHCMVFANVLNSWSTSVVCNVHCMVFANVLFLNL